VATLSSPAAPALAAPSRPSSLAAFRITLAVVAAVTAIRVLFIATAPLELDFEEAQYWHWAQQLAWGYYSKPPLVAWLIAATTGLFGDGEGAVRLASPLLHGATALAVWGIARQLGGPRLAAWSVIAYATLPGIWLSASLITTDVPLLLCWAMALYCLVRRRDGGGAGWSLGCGLTIGAGLLAKYAMLYFLPCALLYLVVDPPARRRISLADCGLALAAAALCLAPNLAWNLAHGFATLRHTADNADLGRLRFELSEVASFVGAQLGLMGPVLFGFLLAGAGDHPADDAMRGNRRLLVCFSLPLILLIVVEAALSRAHANWAAPAYVAGTILAVEAGLRWRWRWLLPAALVGNALAGVAICAALLLVPALPLPKGRTVELGARFGGWRELGRDVAAALGAEPGMTLLVERRPLLALLSYYARPVPSLLEWNPGAVVTDQFTLSASLEPGAAGPFLLVATEPSPEALGHFAAVEPGAMPTIVPAPGIERRYWLFVLRGFKGY
jgi:4-amino-4-deoxy-L-arabinose transferase-like glycosyltransferase